MNIALDPYPRSTFINYKGNSFKLDVIFMLGQKLLKSCNFLAENCKLARGNAISQIWHSLISISRSDDILIRVIITIT